MTETPTETTVPQGAAAGYTPGPWDDASQYPEFDSIRIFAGCHYIATVGNSDDTKEQTMANARLIAAAPELLAACKELSRVWHDDDENAGLSDGLEEEVKLIRAAIAKAETRQ